MKSKKKKLIDFISDTHPVKLLLAMISFDLIVSFSIGFTVRQLTGHTLHEDASGYGIPFYNNGLIVILAGPLIETIIYLWLVFETFKNSLNDYWLIVLSAVLFGLGHMGNPFHVIDTTIVGLMYAVIYVSKGKGLHASLLVFTCHATHNAIAWLL